MVKLDLKRELKELYNPSARTISVVTVPAMNFLQIDGMGDPNTAQSYKDAIEALYTLSYTLKLNLKREQEVNYTVMPLEGLWWVDDMSRFTMADKAAWKWTMLIMQPKPVTAARVQEAKLQAAKKKDLPALADVRFQKFQEGLAAQIMYVGAYADEGPTIAKLHDYIRELGYTLHGKHHEIYLSDPRKTAPAKLRTVIRQPMAKA